LAIPEAQPKQVFTTEDIAKFSLLDDSILFTVSELFLLRTVIQY
jgi:hypothetical protein